MTRIDRHQPIADAAAAAWVQRLTRLVGDFDQDAPLMFFCVLCRTRRTEEAVIVTPAGDAICRAHLGTPEADREMARWR